ncbi:MAG: hypothetical protein MUE94_13965, partial [Verrucomicrobia bacterium]|nr:hypothetical protein [Verrucomicrobiota bacterium]
MPVGELIDLIGTITLVQSANGSEAAKADLPQQAGKGSAEGKLQTVCGTSSWINASTSWNTSGKCPAAPAMTSASKRPSGTDSRITRRRGEPYGTAPIPEQLAIAETLSDVVEHCCSLVVPYRILYRRLAGPRFPSCTTSPQILPPPPGIP